MVSLSQIAARTGVSVATVSLALRGRGMVARETAERIKAMAVEMGYRPNPLLASLATKKFRSEKSAAGTPVAIFNFPITSASNTMRSIAYDSFLKASVAELGYSAKIYQLSSRSDPKRVFRELYHRMVQGILVVGSLDLDSFGGFPWEHFSVVHCGRYQSEQPFHTVRPNIFQGVKLAFTELRARGYRRIGFAMGRHPILVQDDEARLGAALGLEMAHLAERDRLPVYQGEINDGPALLAWAKDSRPDAIVGFSSWFYWQLRDAGYRIPEEVGFMTMHFHESDVRDGIAGLDQNQGEVARQSVFLMDQLIRNRDRGIPTLPMNLLISSSWQDGGTVRPLLT